MASFVRHIKTLQKPWNLIGPCFNKKEQKKSLNHWEILTGYYATSFIYLVILEEIQRTICRPREVCLEVSKEFPDSTSRFYLPRCVAVHRCGGCCSNEAMHCTNTSYTLVNKTVRKPECNMYSGYVTDNIMFICTHTEA